MKKLIAIVVSAVIILSVLAVGVSATTKADLLAEAANSPVYKYVQVAIENAAKTVEITDEQAAQLLPVIQDAVAAVPTDLGPDTSKYSRDAVNNIINNINQVCSVLGLTYEISEIKNAKFAGDMTLKVYSADGKLLFDFDGETVADTSAANDATLYLVAAVVLLGLGVTAVVITRKKVND